MLHRVVAGGRSHVRQSIEGERAIAQGPRRAEPAKLIRRALELREARGAIEYGRVVVGRAGSGSEGIEVAVGKYGGKVDLLAIRQRQLALGLIQLDGLDDRAALVA